MQDMQPLLDELQAILQAEIGAYQHLVELQQTEKRLLVSRALEPFLANLHAKDHRLRTLSRLEQKRQAVLQHLAPLCGLAPGEVTLQQLGAQVPEPWASALLRTRTCLQDLVATLKRSNRETARLLQDSLAFIEERLTFFAALAPNRPTYQRSGTFGAPTQGRLLSGRV